MSFPAAILLLLLGLGLVIYSAEKLVAGAVGTALGFGLPTFLVSVLFIGFDPENLAVGVAASYEGAAGIALGSVIGSAMVAVALALGITALLVPLRFARAPRPVLAVPVVAVALFGVLALDGRLSRLDGALLLVGFVVAVGVLVWLGRLGHVVEAGGEVAEVLAREEAPSRWRAAGLLVLALAAIAVGSEFVVRASEAVITRFGLTDTVFGMTLLALAVSLEEVARQLPAARRGRPEIAFGNVVGSVLAFFLFNAGIIALVRPVEVEPEVLRFYFPLCLGAVVLVSAVMLGRRIPRWAGALLILYYLAFAVGAFFVEGAGGTW